MDKPTCKASKSSHRQRRLTSPSCWKSSIARLPSPMLVLSHGEQPAASGRHNIMDESNNIAEQLSRWIDSQQKFGEAMTLAIANLAAALAALERRIAEVESTLFVENN